MGFLDLEKHFAFYGAYHKNPINITIHMLFVWPIFFTAILLINFIPTPFNLPQINLFLFGNSFFLIFNFGFLFTLIYALIYVCFDYKVGILAALLCFLCWVCSSVLGSFLGFQLAWKVVLVVQLISWTAQFIGHGIFEGRAPALLDNIFQAFLMAPFFVLLEALQIVFGYEPYPGFHDRVTAIIDSETEDWKNKNAKLLYAESLPRQIRGPACYQENSHSRLEAHNVLVNGSKKVNPKHFIFGEFEWRCVLEDAVFKPSFRLKFICIWPPIVFHFSHRVRSKDSGSSVSQGFKNTSCSAASSCSKALSSVYNFSAT